MTESNAFCPKCKQQTVFLTTGRRNTCSVCGFQYESTDPRFAAQPAAGWGIVGVLAKVVLVIIAVSVIGLAVAFAGCAIAFGGF